MKKADKKKDSALIIKSSINIGSGYNSLGYHKTALNYFLKSNQILEEYKSKREAYWVNHVNIGVCYMSLEQYQLAKQYFDKTIPYSPYVAFVKKLNLAKWNGIQGNKEAFYILQKQVSNQVSEYPMYLPIWEELQLDFLIQWNDKFHLLEFINQNIAKYNDKNLYLKIQYNKALLQLKKPMADSIESLLKYKDQIISSNDFFLRDIYFDFLRNYYLNKNDISNFNTYVLLAEENDEQHSKERNMLYVEDFKLAHELEELKDKYSAVQLKNELIQNQLSVTNIKFKLSVVIIVLGLGIIFLIVRNYKKQSYSSLKHHSVTE